MTNNEIILDAKNWNNKNDFYSSYCDASGAPKWFGNNLDALLDSFRGGICKITAEKMVIRNFSSKIKDTLGYEFWKSVEEICEEENVELEVHTD